MHQKVTLTVKKSLFSTLKNQLAVYQIAVASWNNRTMWWLNKAKVLKLITTVLELYKWFHFTTCLFSSNTYINRGNHALLECKSYSLLCCKHLGKTISWSYRRYPNKTARSLIWVFGSKDPIVRISKKGSFLIVPPDLFARRWEQGLLNNMTYNPQNIHTKVRHLIGPLETDGF